MLAAVISILTFGCGAPDGPAKPVNVALDWSANPAHAGLLTAIDLGLDREEGVAIRLRTPPSSSDGTRLLLSGRADLAVLDLHDLAIAQQRGRDLVAVMTVIGKPLASMIASREVKRPRDLEGRTVAVSGAPSDVAVVRSIVAADGGDPKLVRIAQSGYATTQALLGGRADAATGFLNEEGVSLAAKNRGFHVFKLDSYGAPAYPELVLVGTRSVLDSDDGRLKAAVKAMIEGTRLAVADPPATLKLLRNRLPGADAALLEARTSAALDAMLPPNRLAGSVDPELMRQWSEWEAKVGIVAKQPEAARLISNRFQQ